MSSLIVFFEEPFLLRALLAGVLLSMILGYFGLHVVRRRIVFVDLALAQISAVGVAAAVFTEGDPLLYALLFTFAGASLFALGNGEGRIPREAVMGIVYVVASAVAILVVAHVPHGEAEVLKVLFGDILAVGSEQIRVMAAVFAAVALLHLGCRKPLARLTDREGREGGRGWNLLFYLSLGLVIAVAIRTGGVLLVFSYLVIPAVASLLFAREMLWGLVLVWGVGLLGTVGGLMLSYRADLPTGASIVGMLGSLLACLALARIIARYFGWRRD
ncbi:MAG: metal ABC transporter permease [Nitrospirae bacterium]|nr:metal ABC transporter permease [Nitrospirota bacterium]